MDRELIARALDEQWVVRIAYMGRQSCTVQPHAILRKPDGSELLEGYQLRPLADDRAPHGWRHFALGRIDRLELTSEHFEPRLDFQPVSGEGGVVVAKVRRGGTRDSTAWGASARERRGTPVPGGRARLADAEPSAAIAGSPRAG